jgi:hypothetical protein
LTIIDDVPVVSASDTLADGSVADAGATDASGEGFVSQSTNANAANTRLTTPTHAL